MNIVLQILFAICLGIGAYFAYRNFSKISRNINLGKDKDISDNPSVRWNTMFRVAFGQSKMLTRPIPAILHLFVYVGFVVINIEVLEIIIDGLFGTHRVLSFLGSVYSILIGTFEFLAVLVLVGVICFWVRRNVMNIKRFNQPELEGSPKKDANIILYAEVVLMSAFLIMNAADFILQERGVEHYVKAGVFPISQYIAVLLEGMSSDNLTLLERSMWFFHFIGILVFMNYLPFSKHLHIILAFPNTYFSNLEAKGGFSNLESVTNEVKLMLDPNAIPVEATGPVRFGVKDVQDLSWKNLLDAYSCTECGRCTSECPANQTGKLLSPRKIMMSTRDRLEEVGRNIDANAGTFVEDTKTLLHDYITPEELWACTTCNACAEACPININPLEIIIDLRRYLIMEESSAPTSLNNMFTNIENNMAPWQFSPADRLNWATED